MSDAQALVKLGLAGDRARRACERLAPLPRALEAAVRRSLPALARKKVPVLASEPRLALQEDALADLTRPWHVTALRVGEGAAAGALVLDAKAIAYGLEGLLGSGRGTPPALDPGGLTSAQAALAARLARGLVAAFDEVLAPVGAPLAIAPEGGAKRLAEGGAVMVACAVRVGEGEDAGAMMILVPAGVVETRTSGPEEPRGPTAATRAALGEVELELVVELGRARLSLARLGGLHVGEVLRLPISVEAPASLKVGDRVLFRGRPTTRGAQIAVEIDGHEP